MFANFQYSYYGKENEPIFNPQEFKSTAPLVVIDCSNQHEGLQSGPVEVRIDFETSDNVPANTAAYCLILHDKMFSYNPLTKAVRQ
jgi:hypothetical protein